MRPVPSARRALLASLAAAVLAVVLVPATASAATCGRAADAAPTSHTIKRARHAVRCLLNRERAQHGMRKLRGNPRLRRAAVRHTLDMIRRHFFDHTTPGGLDVLARVRAAGYLRNPNLRFTVGENIGWGQSYLGTPRAMVRAWMNSPGHRANILRGSFRHIGIGVRLGTPRGPDGVTYTTNFGTRG